MIQDIERILIARGAISDRVRALAEGITHNFSKKEDDAELVLVAVMTGSIIFVADLMRNLPMKIRIQLMTARSYVGKTTSSTHDPVVGRLPDVTGKHVLLVDDILDSGKTLTRIQSELETLHPKSVDTCVLLRKKLPSAMAVPCTHVGFDIEDEFVVGYGLDYDDYYRNFPDICVINP